MQHPLRLHLARLHSPTHLLTRRSSVWLRSQNHSGRYNVTLPRPVLFCSTYSSLPKSQLGSIPYSRVSDVRLMSTYNHDNKSVNGIQKKEKVTVIGSGNWGSAIARIAAKNTLIHEDKYESTVTMWVFEEDFEGRPLSQIINETHQNPKYLPKIDLGQNVYAEPDLGKALDGATALIIVLPHQFLRKTLEQLINKLGKGKKGLRAVTLIKGVDVRGTNIQTFASVIQSELGVPCSALSGANIAQEVALEHFSESTLGVPVPEGFNGSDEDVENLPDAQLWKPLFHTSHFQISVVADVEGVSLCGALKNIVAVAAGIIDGLGWGSNTKAAIMRIGMEEVKDFCLEYFPSTRSNTFLEESCGIADIITSCLGGRNRQVAAEMVKSGKSFQELEETMLKGQKLQGPETALEVHNFLAARGTSRKAKGQKRVGYPLFDAVYKVCFENLPAKDLVEQL